MLSKTAEQLVKARIHGMRKGTMDIPNWTHAFRIRDALRTHGFSNDVVMAGLLHDIVEDGDTGLDDLRAAGFSERVVTLVDLCSHDVSEKDGTARWVKMMARLAEANDRDAWAIKVADITDNIRSCHTMPKKAQRDFLRHAKGPLVYHLAHASLADHPLLEELRNEIDRHD